MNNVDKPALDFFTAGERLDMFMDKFLQEPGKEVPGYPDSVDTESMKYRLLFTDAPTFVDKSTLFPGAKFGIGYDTALRILNPKYAGSVESVLKTFEANKTSFFMFPREVPGMTQAEVEKIIEVLPGVIVREPMKYRDVSSTAIRQQKA